MPADGPLRQLPSLSRFSDLTAWDSLLGLLTLSHSSMPAMGAFDELWPI